ncbi:MAG: response regulator [Myxococcota bacterium]
MLVVDDEPHVGRMLVRLLRRTHDVVAVADPDEALALAVAEPWEAILCDVMMPGTNGPEFHARLEAARPEAAARLGFMTGGLFDPEMEGFLESLGEGGWLSKPFDRRAVIAYLERLTAPSSEDGGSA